MKFLFVTLTVLFSLVYTESRADEPHVSSVVLEKFHSSFLNASEVKWSFNENLYKAAFVFNGQYINAFYDTSGEMIAVTRNISSMQLPITLQAALKKDYRDFWISDLFELSDDGGATYYVTIEKADARIVLKSSGSFGWTTYQKQKK